ncbi:hypothetical protein [Aurantibacter aestuarii]|uniref:Uncharacterized protein n=1 Tax=Aurantibacter aestuarii TaxID=1266046 RepID=A0A2T1NEL6_9FLAO|nr:hypothetical protein [Aurantibacter aestuarii]PSG90874.1 hypothetical protein C7H52_06265 [Aurantibacter aestuarii]
MIGKVTNNKATTVKQTADYVANLTQKNQENPIVTVLKNDLGFGIEWIRQSENVFYGIANFKFPANATVLLINKPLPETKLERLNSSTIKLTTPDNSLKETTVKIAIIELSGLFSNEFNQNFN